MIPVSNCHQLLEIPWSFSPPEFLMLHAKTDTISHILPVGCGKFPKISTTFINTGCGLYNMQLLFPGHKVTNCVYTTSWLHIKILQRTQKQLNNSMNHQNVLSSIPQKHYANSSGFLNKARNQSKLKFLQYHFTFSKFHQITITRKFKSRKHINLNHNEAFETN